MAIGQKGSEPMFRVLGKLDRVKKSGTGYEARCPGPQHKHEDKHPSLSISTGYDGRVLLKCHAGCETTDVLSALGIAWDDLFERTTTGNPVRRFRLLNTSGQVIAEHVREDLPNDKIIRWESNGRNGLNGTHTEDLPLYRSPDLFSRPDSPVIVCEGEKAAEALAELGLLAVGTVTGAAGTPSESVLAPLQNREVWLWPDNDSMGQSHMAKIATRLQIPPKWIVWKEAPEKGDAADYVAIGGTAEGVAGLVVVPTQHIPPEEFSAADLINMELAEPRWAVPGILPEGVALLVGKSKLGKSWLALDAAIAIAEGTVAWGAIEVEQGEVYYLALEDSKKRLQDRLRTLCSNGEAPRGLTIRLTSPRADEGGIENILDWLGRHPRARMIIIDVLGKFRPKEANARRLYDLDYEAIAPIAEVARQRGVCVLVIHHANKLNPEDPVDSVSGTTGLVGAADAICIFRRERGKADASLFVVGRDVEEQDLAFRNSLKSPGPHAWEMIGDAAQLRLSEQRRLIIDVITAQPGMSASDVAAASGKSIGATRYLLFQMTREGQIRNRDGRYFPEATIHTAPITPITLSPAISPQSQNGPVSISDPIPYRGYRGNSEFSGDSAVSGRGESPMCRLCGMAMHEPNYTCPTPTVKESSP